jgi:YgiT-type zinc finger domain-containing protein
MKNNKCPICGGNISEAVTIFSAELGTGVVVVRNVPASICEQCGEEWIDNKTAMHLEDLSTDAKKQKRQVEVLAY